MKSINPALLPPPPPDKIGAGLSVSGHTGWPWIQPELPFSNLQPDGAPWPKISIVTPSYNQARFLEETVRSVLLQGYPHLEYIIIDGGSKDGSVDIIQKYAPWLAYWVSEPDRGQSHAINKGFSHASGEIMAWINSDDFYAPNAFYNVVMHLGQEQTEWIAGNCYIIESDGSIQPGQRRPNEDPVRWLIGNMYDQPTVFWKRTLWEKTRGIDESLHYAFDYDLWMQFSETQSFPSWTDAHLAYFRIHEQSKTSTRTQYFFGEMSIVQDRYNHRIKSRWQRFKYWKFLREKKANDCLIIKHRDESILLRIITGLFIAPWYILNLHFYYRIKVMLMARKRSQI